MEKLLRNIVCNQISYVVLLRPEKTKKSAFLNEFHRKRYETARLTLSEIVTTFFEENSRMCPGKKDCITRKKIKKQKMLLNDSIAMLYEKFRKVHPAFKISRSLFVIMKPFWVVHAKATERDTCMCIKHENFSLLLQALYRAKTIDTSHAMILISSLMCTPYTEECLARKCKR